jgi:hypothetical protein
MVVELLNIIFDGMTNAFSYSWLAFALIIGIVFILTLIVARASFLLSAGFTMLIFLPAVSLLGINFGWVPAVAMIVLGAIVALSISYLFASR